VISRLKKPKPRPTADSIFAGQPVVLAGRS
jgi:hypothetical protein